MLDADGMITAMSEGWIFTPAKGATSDQPDYDYLHYGFWLQKTADCRRRDSPTTRSRPSPVRRWPRPLDVAAVTGKARPTNGGATGVYVHSEVILGKWRLA